MSNIYLKYYINFCQLFLTLCLQSCIIVYNASRTLVEFRQEAYINEQKSAITEEFTHCNKFIILTNRYEVFNKQTLLKYELNTPKRFCNPWESFKNVTTAETSWGF